MIKPALETVCTGRNARVVLVGAGLVDLSSVPVEIRPWSYSEEVTEIQQFDVGIMPLPDAPWERGKCGYKLIQYMACAKPVVASPVGANCDIVKQGVNGFLASTQAEWIDALNTLRSQPEVRVRMGSVGRCDVESKFCLRVTAPRLLALLREAVV